MQHFIVPNQNLNQKKENKMDNTRLFKFFTAVLMSIFVIVLTAFIALPGMLLWNSFLVPVLTIVKPITWTQTWGIMVLISLFKPLNTNS